MRHTRYTRPARRFVSGRRRNEKEWLALPATVATTAAAGAGVTQLISFEAPTLVAGTPLTADPPQDRLVLRLIGRLTYSTTVAGTVGVGLILTDRTWTPVGTVTITPDLDKRWLWWREVPMAAGDALTPQTLVNGGGGLAVSNAMYADKDPTFFDISPKVRLEDGKSLNLVVYFSGAVTAPVVTTMSFRMLLGARK